MTDRIQEYGLWREILEKLQIQQFRRVATRYEKRADNYLALLTLASIILWL